MLHENWRTYFLKRLLTFVAIILIAAFPFIQIIRSSFLQFGAKSFAGVQFEKPESKKETEYFQEKQAAGNAPQT